MGGRALFFNTLATLALRLLVGRGHAAWMATRCAMCKTTPPLSYRTIASINPYPHIRAGDGRRRRGGDGRRHLRHHSGRCQEPPQDEGAHHQEDGCAYAQAAPVPASWVPPAV